MSDKDFDNADDNVESLVEEVEAEQEQEVEQEPVTKKDKKVKQKAAKKNKVKSYKYKSGTITKVALSVGFVLAVGLSAYSIYMNLSQSQENARVTRFLKSNLNEQSGSLLNNTEALNSLKNQNEELQKFVTYVQNNLVDANKINSERFSSIENSLKLTNGSRDSLLNKFEQAIKNSEQTNNNLADLINKVANHETRLQNISYSNRLSNDQLVSEEKEIKELKDRLSNEVAKLKKLISSRKTSSSHSSSNGSKSSTPVHKSTAKHTKTKSRHVVTNNQKKIHKNKKQIGSYTVASIDLWGGVYSATLSNPNGYRVAYEGDDINGIRIENIQQDTLNLVTPNGIHYTLKI